MILEKLANSNHSVEFVNRAGQAGRRGVPKTEAERLETHLSLFGTPELPPRGTGRTQAIGTYFDDLKAWWDTLPDWQKYAILGGGLLVVVLLVISSGKSSSEKLFEQMMKLKMLEALK